MSIMYSMALLNRKTVFFVSILTIFAALGGHSDEGRVILRVEPFVVAVGRSAGWQPGVSEVSMLENIVLSYLQGLNGVEIVGSDDGQAANYVLEGLLSGDAGAISLTLTMRDMSKNSSITPSEIKIGRL
jgi:hypothetical protein